MRPFVQILASGNDLAAGLGDRLLSVECHDEAEDKSDRVAITIDDRPRFGDLGVVSMPGIGMTVEIVMGYQDGAAASRGTFLIDELGVSSPARQLVVTGRAANMTKSYRTPRTQSYHQMTVGEIMQEIAGRNGYAARVDAKLSGIVVRHIDQHNESDMAFATRLAAMHDAVAKPVAGRLVAAKRGTGNSVTGATLPVVVLTESMCESWDFKYSARDEAGEASGMDSDNYGGESADAVKPDIAGNIITTGSESGSGGGVRAVWTDIRTGEKKVVLGGQAPYHDLRYSYHNEAEAVAAVSEKMNASKRGKASFSCTIGGKVDVQAEAKLFLSNFRPYIPTLWRIKSCEHRFDAGGYTTTIEAELFEAKQDDVPGKVKGTTPTDDDKIDKDAPPESVKPDKSTDEFIINVPSGQ
ncbi:phage late control D family protein [Rhizobium ruizarguesonis]